ncbi:MAG: SpoIIE family protein phosphatase [Telmatospirillum sp.]|nr:SpoIIE family protein phosphatase [Telmatospirillum sp.]
MGWEALKGIRDDFGLAYARNLNDLSRQTILAPVSRELALSLRLADSEVTRRWIQDEADPAKRSLFLAEAEGYRRSFREHSWFLVVESSRNHYFRDDRTTADRPIETLSPDQKKDSWYFATMRNTNGYNINVDINVPLNQTKVWFNVVVRDGDRKIGLAGTGLDLSRFLETFVVSNAAGVTPMIIDGNGAIQAHRDKSLIALNSASGGSESQRTAFDLLDTPESRQSLARAMQTAGEDVRSDGTDTGHSETAWVDMDGKRQLAAVSYIPELRWYVLTIVDLNAARFIDTGWIVPAIVAVGLLLFLLLLGFGSAVETLVLAPLRRLQHSAQAMAEGNYDVALPTPRRDEIGALTRSFGVMADQIRQHTADLEQKVRERTQALETTHRQMAEAHKKLGDSIDYASLIQRAILPDRQMLQSLGPHHFVFWLPRDVVGGDFYVFHEEGDHCLLGIVDCAGHGVPGALMTMLARAAIDHALREVGHDSPAAVLARTDRAMRAMIEDSQMAHVIATNMDVGLVSIDRARHRILFAGARISLYWSDGVEVQEIKGSRRAIGDRKVGDYEDHDLDLHPDRTYCLTTDGFLDQAGGDHGYGFGRSRFAEMLRDNAHLPLTEQGKAIAKTLADYQGTRPQRDDITVLSFRFD